MPAASPAWTFCAWSTSLPRLPGYGLDKRQDGIVAFTTWAAAFRTSPSSRSATASSKCWPPTATRAWAATTSTTILLRHRPRGYFAPNGASISRATAARCNSCAAASSKAKERLSSVRSPPSSSITRAGATGANSAGEQFEGLVRGIVDRTLGPCRNCIKDAGVPSNKSTKWCWWAARRAFRWCARPVENLFRARPHTELKPGGSGRPRAAVQGRHPHRGRSG